VSLSAIEIDLRHGVRLKQFSRVRPLHPASARSQRPAPHLIHVLDATAASMDTGMAAEQGAVEFVCKGQDGLLTSLQD